MRPLGMNELVPIQNPFSIPSLDTAPSYHYHHTDPFPFVLHGSLSFFLSSIFHSLTRALFDSATNITTQSLLSFSRFASLLTFFSDACHAPLSKSHLSFVPFILKQSSSIPLEQFTSIQSILCSSSLLLAACDETRESVIYFSHIALYDD